MLTEQIAKEIDLMSKVDHWLSRSLTQSGKWALDGDEARHKDAVKHSRAMSLTERFPTGELLAESLSDALSGEFLRLATGPDLLRHALKACVWPPAFHDEGKLMLSHADAMSPYGN